MKLILTFYTGGMDGCDVYCAFEADDKEIAKIELMEAAHKAKDSENQYFKFHGHELCASYFFDREVIRAKKSERAQSEKITYIEPNIYTLDELFELFQP